MTRRQMDELVAAIAGVQWGVISRDQALSCGATDGQILRRLRSGLWKREAPGVYRLAGWSPCWMQRLWVARLAVGPSCVVSHEAAAALHAVEGFPPGPVTLVAPHGSHPRLHGATVHQTRDIWSVECEVLDGLPVTTPARTILDLAATRISRARMHVVIDDLLTRRKVTYGAITTEMAAQARPGKPGVVLLTRVLEARVGDPVKQSHLERAHFAIYARFGGPRPLAQWPYPGRQQVNGCADAGFPDALLAVETDGRKWHTRVRDLQRDHHRDAEAARHGVQVLRLMYEDVVADPQGAWDLVQATRRIRLAQLQPRSLATGGNDVRNPQAIASRAGYGRGRS